MTQIISEDYFEHSKLGILCLPNYERVKTGRKSPFYLNCSHVT